MCSQKLSSYQKLKIESAGKNKLIEEYANKLKYLQAEFENYKKYTEKEKNNYLNYANENLISKLLIFLDSFESFINKNIVLDESSCKEFLEGINMIYKDFRNILIVNGLEEIPTNTKFDPFLHECVLYEQSNQPENTILEVIHKGYKFKDKIIRPAKVKISKGGANG